jgi:hypothetical protein
MFGYKQKKVFGRKSQSLDLVNLSVDKFAHKIE